jgi:Uma2 family endonuclease
MHGMSWWQYETILAARGESPVPRIAYAHETVELTSPSHRHEEKKSLLGLLVEAYLFEKGVHFVPWGSTTLKNASVAKGAEPDESYAFAKGREVPDLAIEAVLTSGGLDKLQIYGALGVSEVWFWSEAGLQGFALEGGAYRPIEVSEVIPGLALATLAHYADQDDVFEAVQAFRAHLRG